MTKTAVNLTYIAFTTAFIGMVVSLYFSEIMHFLPCVLCWYQRICLYPLVVIFGVGILRKDRHVFWYALPLSLAGLLIASFHNLLYYGVIPEQYAPCTAGISCTEQYLNIFGFISIPLLSLIAFSIITACMAIIWKEQKK